MTAARSLELSGQADYSAYFANMEGFHLSNVSRNGHKNYSDRPR